MLIKSQVLEYFAGDYWHPIKNVEVFCEQFIKDTFGIEEFEFEKGKSKIEIQIYDIPTEGAIEIEFLEEGSTWLATHLKIAGEEEYRCLFGFAEDFVKEHKHFYMKVVPCQNRS